MYLLTQWVTSAFRQAYAVCSSNKFKRTCNETLTYGCRLSFYQPDYYESVTFTSYMSAHPGPVSVAADKQMISVASKLGTSANKIPATNNSSPKKPTLYH